MFETPVILLIFNRPDHTRQTFEILREIQPRRLFVVADGPRNGEEYHQCEAARSAATNVDWECDVATNFSDHNMGCRHRVSSGLDWAFTHCDEAIILEDDCVADATFFPFCTELLDRYREDDQVMAVSGDNFQAGRKRGDASYYFSLYPHCWGWATWARAWQHYDANMEQWPQLRDSDWLTKFTGRVDVAEYWRDIFDHVYEDRINSWAYRWTWSCWSRGGVTALPNINLVQNIGFDETATHTHSPDCALSIPTGSIGPLLRHPESVICDQAADRYTFDTLFSRWQPRPHDRWLAPLQLLKRVARRVWQRARIRLSSES